MLKRSIVLMLFALVMVGSSFAQVRPGIKMGYNLGGVMGDYRNSADATKAPANPDNFLLRSGFQGGMVADCPVNETFAIQPGVRFAMHGFTDKYLTNITSGDKVTRRFSLFFLQVPVYAQYRLNIAEETNLLFQAGPYVGYGLFGRQSYMRKGKSVDLKDDQKKITFGGNKSKDIRNGFDFGLGAGVGIEFYRVQFMVAYDFGLNKMAFEKDAGSATYNLDLRNHNLSVTLAIIFGRRDPLQGKD